MDKLHPYSFITSTLAYLLHFMFQTNHILVSSNNDFVNKKTFTSKTSVIASYTHAHMAYFYIVYTCTTNGLEIYLNLNESIWVRKWHNIPLMDVIWRHHTPTHELRYVSTNHNIYLISWGSPTICSLNMFSQSLIPIS